MTRAQDFYTSDIKRALGAREHELRAWLALDPLRGRKRERREACAYSALDLLFLAVIQQLHRAGFAPKGMQSFSAALYKAIAQPVAGTGSDEVLLHQTSGGVLKMGQPPADGFSLEIKIPLRPARVLVLQYTGALQVSGQGELNLLASIHGTGSRTTSIHSGVRRASR